MTVLQHKTGSDLFCGGGGMTAGVKRAARRLGIRVSLYAVNHCNLAIATHYGNNPDVHHLLADIEALEPREVVKGGYLDFMVASPECIYFSKARGGKPINDQRRSSASYVLKWCRELDIPELLLENVQEFADWGPIYPDDYPDKKLAGKPIKERKGELFQEFVSDLRSLGYRVEWRVLCAADYGDATSRERFFLRASKRGAIHWPKPTHPREKWRPAREIIDWSFSGLSIYDKRPNGPLAVNTMKRILTGVRKFSGLAPFLVEYHGNHPGTNSGDRRVRSVDEPLATQDTSNRFGIAQPFLTKLYGGHDACGLDQPLGTITAQYEHYGLAQPFLMNITHSKSPTGYVYSVDDPMRTIVAQEEFGLAQPCLTVLRNHADGLPIDGPLPTICAEGQHIGISQPFLTKYYHTGVGQELGEPLHTVTTKERFALTDPRLQAMDCRDRPYLLRAFEADDPLYRPLMAVIDGTAYLVDILYRMLFPRELAAAMSFPANYVFVGSNSDQVRMIGNAVPVELATELCYSMLTN